MKRGAVAESPSALRISAMQTFSTPSATCVPGQTRSRSWSFETNCPARSMSASSTSKALGFSRIAHRRPLELPVRTVESEAVEVKDHRVVAGRTHF